VAAYVFYSMFSINSLSVSNDNNSEPVRHIFFILKQVWDLRKNAVLYQMVGHSDTVTGMELSPDGSYLLTTAMDNTGQHVFLMERLVYLI